MPEHSFTLVIEGDVEAKVDDLFEAGCADATFGSADGVHYATFDREAPTLDGAIGSAVADVESVPGLRVLRVEPDGAAAQPGRGAVRPEEPFSRGPEAEGGEPVFAGTRVPVKDLVEHLKSGDPLPDFTAHSSTAVTRKQTIAFLEWALDAARRRTGTE